MANHRSAHNMFNASLTLALNTTYGSAWLRPLLQILQGRLVEVQRSGSIFVAFHRRK